MEFILTAFFVSINIPFLIINTAFLCKLSEFETHIWWDIFNEFLFIFSSILLLPDLFQ